MAKKQTATGKAFEYCFALAYYEFLSDAGLKVNLLRDVNFANAESSYNTFNLNEQAEYFKAAKSTIATMIKLEPMLIHPQGNDLFDSDILEISIAPDAAGQAGDVRDVIFKRHKWQIGFSLKNNHDASKHSRLSSTIDFGKDWLNYECSDRYFEEIKAVFAPVLIAKTTAPHTKWDDYPSKEMSVYVPVLLAFKKELERLNATEEHVPQKLLSYLLGKDSFYKVIKRDALNMVVIKGYNMNKDLGKSHPLAAAACSIPTIAYPTRIIEFSLLGSNTTLFMTLDKGWQISFRIHSASTTLETSLKFDITLIGNPPSLFTHYVF